MKLGKLLCEGAVKQSPVAFYSCLWRGLTFRSGFLLKKAASLLCFSFWRRPWVYRAGCLSCWCFVWASSKDVDRKRHVGRSEGGNYGVCQTLSRPWKKGSKWSQLTTAGCRESAGKSWTRAQNARVPARHSWWQSIRLSLGPFRDALRRWQPRSGVNSRVTCWSPHTSRTRQT